MTLKKRDRRTNPCSGESGKKLYPVVAHKVAKEMQEAAKTQLDGKDGGRSKLKADASEGHYSRGGDPTGFKKEKLCEITAKHSNDKRRNNGGPCQGKDEGRFKIGTQWKGGEQVKTSYKDFYLPPRREHMCTSNLEYLETGESPLNGSDYKLVNNSFLGDVLLAAKEEAKKIKELYEKNKDTRGLNDKNGLTDDKTVCRAMKYSFADIGDIIRGRDLWDGDRSSKDMERNLKKIFNTIRQKLPTEIEGKYKKDEDPYKQLREDWWEANRDQVWNAMKCEISQLKDKSGPQSSLRDHCGYSRGTPPDDYIPQRLRWMTEWAEWFCKMQKEEYEALAEKYRKCRSKGDGKQCMKDDGECKTCTEACTTYGDKIKKWQKQWETISKKYDELYGQAQTITGPTGFYDPDYQQVVDFFKELQ